MNSRKVKRKVEDIVIYHGSLEELNKRSRVKYYFAEDTDFISDFYEFRYTSDTNISHIRPALPSRVLNNIYFNGYDGLVNARTLFLQSLGGLMIGVEGTPIKRRRHGKK